MSSTDVARNFASILERIEAARKAALQPAPSTSLIAVSKSHQEETLLPALALGHRLFGENRVQEAMQKWPSIKERFRELQIHLIGPLQSNKVGDAIHLFDAIHTLDRPKLARALAAAVEVGERCPELFVQVNIGEEPQKSGVAPSETDNFLKLCRELGLPVQGLMCIPPVGANAAPYFALLREMARANGLAKLSMGMSDDFETAIRFGATHVRIGTALFGARAAPDQSRPLNGA